MTAREPRIRVGYVAGRIAADGQALPKHQLALTAAIVQHQMPAHITAPM